MKTILIEIELEVICECGATSRNVFTDIKDVIMVECLNCGKEEIVSISNIVKI